MFALNMLYDNTLCFMTISKSNDEFVAKYEGDDIRADKMWLDTLNNSNEYVSSIATEHYHVKRTVAHDGTICVYGRESACYEYTDMLNRI